MPVEDVAGALKDLVAEGKVLHFGLFEPGLGGRTIPDLEWSGHDVCRDAAIIRAAVGEATSKRVPARRIPDFVLRILGLFNPEIRAFVPDLGRARKTSSEKVRRLLGWTPGSPRAAIASAATSILQKGMVNR